MALDKSSLMVVQGTPFRCECIQDRLCGMISLSALSLTTAHYGEVVSALVNSLHLEMVSLCTLAVAHGYTNARFARDARTTDLKLSRFTLNSVGLTGTDDQECCWSTGMLTPSEQNRDDSTVYMSQQDG